ncbi:MAG: helix-turn-helix domain-containing protein [Azonexus sp.]
MKIGATVRSLRQERGMTQEELAFRANTTAGTISRIETNRHHPGEQLLDTLASALGLRVHELVAHAEGFRLADRLCGSDAEEQALLGHFRAMRGEQRRLLLQVAANFAGRKAD